MSIPVIGITANTHSAQVLLADSYVQSVLRAGGAPVILPPVLEGEALIALFSKLDGVLISGGSDIDPARYNGLPHPSVYGIDFRRDEQEIQLIRMAAGQEKPFLGICRGIQAVNVALGGTLYTDINDQLDGALKHDWYPDEPRDTLAHGVSILPKSILAHVLGGEQFKVNSMHHQGIQQTAAALIPSAYAPDGLVEAVELPRHPFGIGVQWHPECLPERQEQLALFQAFIQAAAKSRSTGR